jgi:hypothetical protein
MEIERAMIEDEGLASRPFYRHLIYAPQPTYREAVLPRIFESIESDDWEAIPRFEQQLVDAFNHAVTLVEEATDLLTPHTAGSAEE